MGDSAEGVVFTPWRRDYTVLGVRLRCWGPVLAALAAGVALFLALGLPTVEVERALTSSEQAAALAELQELREAVASYEQAAEDAGTWSMQALGLDEEEQALVARARELGISADATDTELGYLVPTETTDEEARFDAVTRAFVLVVLPTGAAYVWHLQLGHGWSMSEEFGRFRAFAARQRVYATGRRRYVERGCGR